MSTDPVAETTECAPGRPVGWVPARGHGRTLQLATAGGLPRTREVVTDWCQDARPHGAWRPVALVEADDLTALQQAVNGGTDEDRGVWATNAAVQMERVHQGIQERDRAREDAAETRRHLTAVLDAIAAGELCSPRYDRVTEAREFLAGTGAAR